ADWLREGERPRAFRRAGFAELAGEYASPGRPVILDVRRDSERAGGHIAGSVHIPVHQVRDRLGEIPPGTVWVHCAGGMRAAVAASLLDAADRDVVAVDDFFAAAAASGLPMTPSTPSTPGASPTPALPGASSTHAIPGTPSISSVPDTPAMPSAPSTPGIPGTPGALPAPSAPGAADRESEGPAA
ncbi:rhodanese-like domain-containing protein, partial [Streptomyces sp. NPDC058398]|uniref:rhodanese-like domain-containing protein n=1 Tax=Streptomyces sp. NPDC058398 TaxID=3346479 RepID=UPI00364E6941